MFKYLLSYIVLLNFGFAYGQIDNYDSLNFQKEPNIQIKNSDLEANKTKVTKFERFKENIKKYKKELIIGTVAIAVAVATTIYFLSNKSKTDEIKENDNSDEKSDKTNSEEETDETEISEEEELASLRSEKSKLESNLELAESLVKEREKDFENLKQQHADLMKQFGKEYKEVIEIEKQGALISQDLIDARSWVSQIKKDLDTTEQFIADIEMQNKDF